MITRPGDKNIGVNAFLSLWFHRMKAYLFSFLHLSSPNQDALIWSNVILIYHFSAAGKTLSSLGLFEKLLDTKTDPGNFAHAVNQSDTPECSDPNSLFFVYRYQTASPILLDKGKKQQQQKYVNRGQLFIFIKIYLFCIFNKKWLVSVQGLCGQGLGIKARQRARRWRQLVSPCWTRPQAEPQLPCNKDTKLWKAKLNPTRTRGTNAWSRSTKPFEKFRLPDNLDLKSILSWDTYFFSLYLDFQKCPPPLLFFFLHV